MVFGWNSNQFRKLWFNLELQINIVIDFFNEKKNVKNKNSLKRNHENVCFLNNRPRRRTVKLNVNDRVTDQYCFEQTLCCHYTRRRPLHKLVLMTVLIKPPPNRPFDWRMSILIQNAPSGIRWITCHLFCLRFEALGLTAWTLTLTEKYLDEIDGKTKKTRSKSSKLSLSISANRGLTARGHWRIAQNLARMS